MTEQPPAISKAKIGVFALAMLNLAIICTLRGLPIMAEEGLSLVFYFLITAIIFVIPVSFVCAELATGWPPQGPGGVYIWVYEAFGPKLGFIAIWLQWVQNVVWFPTMLSFLGATIAYVYDPSLANNKYYMISVILVSYWGGTILNFKGLKVSSLVSMICVIVGTVLPGILIIAFGINWYSSGEPLSITFSFNNLMPDLSNIRNIVFLAGAVVIMAGIEVSAAHSSDVKNPKSTYPKAIFLATLISIILLTLGSLSIAIIVPKNDLSLVGGVMEVFRLFLEAHSLTYLIPTLSVLIFIGAVGELLAWIIGPAKGLMTTARDGNLPPFLQKVNNKNVPTNILIVQAVVVTMLSAVFLFMPTVSSSYWILTALSVILYLIMYFLIFASSIKLRYSRPDVIRSYTIPGGNPGIWFVAGIGMLGCLFTFVVSFFPPSQISTGSPLFYETFLIVGTITMCLIPLIVMHFRKDHWKKI
ncbi:MAG: amino acid permease [Pseudomonadota bacterium]